MKTSAHQNSFEPTRGSFENVTTNRKPTVINSEIAIESADIATSIICVEEAAGAFPRE
jgi:hypothetical protein